MMDRSTVIWMIANGDLRESANTDCWPSQHAMEQSIVRAFQKKGYQVKRAHEFDQKLGHGFINSQKMGLEVFRHIPSDAPVVVADGVWQYSQFVLGGLMYHEGPILTIANWDGKWPGLVGLLNLNASMTKAGVRYSSLWSETFDDPFFENGLQEWLDTEYIQHDQSQVKDFDFVKVPLADQEKGRDFARRFRKHKAILGVFDEGCMGMFNAMVPDDILNKLGLFKERLSQSMLYARMRKVSDKDAQSVLDWLLEKGMKFEWGTDGKTELTKEQTLEQCRMYVAAVRMADEYGCSAIGIQYQQGLKELTTASDMVEGLLNNTERPPVFSEDGRELFKGELIPHFNEVDECAGIDTLLTHQLWEELGLPSENTLHDIRWGAPYKDDKIDDFVWLFMISGAIPAAHLKNGYKDAVSKRQGAMFFPFGGGTLTGVSKPGPLVWSRIYVEDHQLHCDMGVGESVELSQEEVEKRFASTNPEWPMMNAILPGISRDQLMAKHKSNHIHVVYAPDEAAAHKLCRIKASALAELGVKVHFCGEIDYAGEKFK